MVQAIINIEKETNQILNIVKAKYGLKDKSQAIDQMAKEYSQELLENSIRPEYVERMKKIQKEPTIAFDSVEDMRKHFDIK